ncbi:MAG: hypothetical protein RAP03_21915, partial [Candidatus Electryonea clarkiae]|nr:hypothetical protein [Candidatus Electryonea clarkiae]
MPFTSFLHDSHQRAELPAQWRLSLVSGNPPAQIKDKFKNIPAQVPGCVHLDLLRHNLMPDPFFGLNEKDVAWIAECDWEYKCNFSLPTEPVQTDGQIRKQFVFEGLDTFAEIQIDGKVLGDSANMFVPHRFELPENLAEGEHELRIVFRSPVNEVEHLTKMRGRVPDAFGGNRGWARKAGYSFGWDWGPILPTSGIWRPAYIQSWDLGRIAWFSSHFELVEKGGQLSLRIGVNTEIKGEFQLEIKLNDEEKSIEKTINFESGADKAETIVESKIDISNPNLWWANGTGKPNLYNLSIVLLHEGKETHKISEQIGLRTVEWVQEDDKWGKSFYVRLNGKNIFAKGANWIPADSFLPRVKSHHYEILLNAAVKANMNMVRVWGGGIYEDQEFYRIADKLGIMIWQDFPYACALYPDDEEFYSNAREEAISAVAELARHPSIVLWCGNNEIERDTDSLKSENQVSLSCESLWNDILPVALANIDPYAAYIPSSPTGGDIANASEIGDRHVWSVWSGWKHEK